MSDTVPEEVVEIAPEDFRQRLARARRDLRNFMNDKCGLLNPANPCRCPKKTRGFIEAGHVDPNNLLFARKRVFEVREAAPIPTKLSNNSTINVLTFTASTPSINHQTSRRWCGD